MATRRSLEAQIAEQEKKKAQLEARIKQLKARQSETARKERTRRLIQVGAIVEAAMGVEMQTQEQRDALQSSLSRRRTDKNGKYTTIGSCLANEVCEEVQKEKSANSFSQEPEPQEEEWFSQESDPQNQKEEW